MTLCKNNCSTIKATKGNQVRYLSTRDETKGLDIQLDLSGWTLTAI